MGEGFQWLKSILKTAGISHCLTLLIDLTLAFFTKTVAFLILMHILPVCPGACFYCSFHLMLDLGYNFVDKISTKGVGGQWLCRTIYTYFNGIHSIMLFTMKFEISKHNHLKKKVSGATSPVWLVVTIVSHQLHQPPPSG